MKQRIIILVIGFLLASCEEKINWQLDSIPPDLCIVDGRITNEYKRHLIKLTKPVSNLNDVPEVIGEAEVLLSDGFTVMELIEIPKNSGNYYTDSMSFTVDRKYKLEIFKESNYYFANAEMIPVTPFSLVKVKLSEANDTMFQIDEKFSSEEDAIWELQLQFTNSDGITYDAALYYYTIGSLDVSQLFAPQKEIIAFPRGTRIIQKKYSMAPEHAAYIRSLLLETEWRGGYFDISAANVNTNLSNGAKGFFSASTVLTDTLLIP